MRHSLPMPRAVVVLLLLLLPMPLSHAQIKHTTIPMGDALTKALALSSLISPGARPFHLVLAITEPENPQSPYQATLEEWWSSDKDWRREITSPQAQLKQIIAMHDGVRSEADTGDYFPLWLRSFVTATFDPVPDAPAWEASGITIDQITMPNGAHSEPCARAKSKIGTGDQATDAFSSVCFAAQGRLGFYGSPRYNMEFHDYRGFGGKQFPRQLVDNPEPGTKLGGDVTVLEDLAKVPDTAALFAPLPATDDRFQSVSVGSATMDKLTTGQDGKPVQIDGGLGLSFDAHVGDPLPELNDTETRALAISQPEPQWPAGKFPKGTAIEAVVSVNVKGQVAGVSFSKTPADAVGPINLALSGWHFRPLIHDGHPQYFHGTVRFLVP